MKKSTIIILSVAGLIILYLYIFWGKRPFSPEITQDRPIIKMLCKMQIACGVGTGQFTCSEDLGDKNYEILRKWKGFHGCNNQTKGYENGYVSVEYCGCGGIM